MLWIIISTVIIIADQLVKWIIMGLNLPQGSYIFSAFNIIDIAYDRNTGGAWSILNEHTWILSIISVVFCIAVAVYWIKKKPSHPLLCTSLAMIFAGALSNGIDRLFYSEGVVDYVRFAFWKSFPTFNIADMAITIGAALFVWYIIRFDNEDKNAETKN